MPTVSVVLLLLLSVLVMVVSWRHPWRLGRGAAVVPVPEKRLWRRTVARIRAKA
jgi:hypothetical protein